MNISIHDGNSYILDFLKKSGVDIFFGVNGGGIIYITKNLNSIYDYEFRALKKIDKSLFFTIPEYTAGFCPIGYYLSSKRISCTIITTGAATKLAGSGMSDARYMNIPSLYLIAMNSYSYLGKSPLQDVSVYGMNIDKQIQAEFGDDCFVIDSLDKIRDIMKKSVDVIINKHKPAVICFYPDVLCQIVNEDFYPNIDKDVKEIRDFQKKYQEKIINSRDLENFVNFVCSNKNKKKIVIFVCLESYFYKNIKNLINELSILLDAKIIWSVNGANSVDGRNPNGMGYILLGGNDKSLEIWNSLNDDDIMISIGFDCGEYTLAMEKINVGDCFIFSNIEKPYGSDEIGSYKHRVEGRAHEIKGDISLLLEHANRSICKMLNLDFSNENIDFFTSQDGSAMGSAFGLGVGAKIGNPSKNVFIFSGDGCWRLYGSNMPEVSELGINLFVFNNESYSIVSTGLDIIIPGIKDKNKHSKIKNINFVEAAKSFGWIGIRLNPNLDNLEEIMDLCYKRTLNKGKSVLIEVCTSKDQTIGFNPRYKNLTNKSNL